jgi:4-hydroxy-3-polyprenylbenzoate decarboxylase
MQEAGRDVSDLLLLADRSYNDWNQAAAISSGSFLTLGMVVAPCGPTSLASIALGYANTLIHRAADVTMKEGRRLTLLVTMTSLNEAQSQHVARLERVPGVTVRAAPPDATIAHVDAVVYDVLREYGVEVERPASSSHAPDKAPKEDA